MKKLLSFVLAFTMVVSLLTSTVWAAVTPTAGWLESFAGDTLTIKPAEDLAAFNADGNAYSGTPAEKWYTKRDSVIEVATAEQLVTIFKDMAENANQFARKTVKLVADITINVGDFRDWEKNAPKYNWFEINNYSDFRGTFDGNGHTISGIYANGFAEGTTYMSYEDYKHGQDDEHYTGFFQKLGGTVKNLRITNSYFTGPYGTSAIAGYLSADSVFENVQIDTSKVFGTYAQAADPNLQDIVGQAGPYEKHSATGAFVGLCSVSNITLTNCVFQGTLVGGGRFVGGLLGNLNQAHVVMTNSGFIGVFESFYSMYYNGVNLSKENSGGLLGRTNDTTEKGVEMTNCFFIGSFKANPQSTTSGAFIGRCNKFTAVNCWASADAYDKFYDSSKTTNTAGGDAGMEWIDKDEQTSAEAVAIMGLDESVFVAVEGIGPLLKMFSMQTHTHSYDNACDADCNECGDVRGVADHVYSDEDDIDCNECGAERELPVGSDGQILIYTDKDPVEINDTFEVYFDLDAIGAPVGSIDFVVSLSENVELVSAEVLVTTSQFMMSMFNQSEMRFGCGMTMMGVTGQIPLLKLTLKAVAEGEATVSIDLKQLGCGVGNLVGDGLLDFSARAAKAEVVLHICKFVNQVAEEAYLRTAATCTEAATYYMSCECGEHNEEFFTYGKELGHKHEEWLKNEEQHWHKCSVCGTVEDEGAHSYGPWEGDDAKHWKSCTVCGNVIEEGSHEYDHDFDAECSVCLALRKVPMGTDGKIVIRTDKDRVVVDRTFDVYFDLNVLTQPAGSVDFGVLLSENLELVSAEVLVTTSQFMMSMFNADEMRFGCGMTLTGVTGEIPLLKLTLKPTAEGEAKVWLTVQNGGVGNLVGDGVLDYNAQFLTVEAVIHVCEFVYEVAEEGYLRSEATCTEAATYYLSCECGEHAEDYFSYGDALGHDHSDFWDVDCNRCGEVRTRPLIGDANGDGTVNFSDIQRIYQHLSTANKLAGDALIIADANKDGTVNFSDIQRIYQHLSTSNKLF